MYVGHLIRVVYNLCRRSPLMLRKHFIFHEFIPYHGLELIHRESLKWNLNRWEKNLSAFYSFYMLNIKKKIKTDAMIETEQKQPSGAIKDTSKKCTYYPACFVLIFFVFVVHKIIIKKCINMVFVYIKTKHWCIGKGNQGKKKSKTSSLR